MSKRFKLKSPYPYRSAARGTPRASPRIPSNKPGGRRLSTINPKAKEIETPEPPPSTPEDSFVSVKVIRTISPPRRYREEDSGLDAASTEYSWREDGRWHEVNKRVDHEADADELEPVMVGRYGKSKGDGDGAVMGKRDAALVSMRMFSGEYGGNDTKSLLSSSRRFWKEEEEHGGVASVSVLRRTTSMESGGKVRDSVAVLKRSENPLEDFKTSMIKMAVERRMFEARDLERLLRRFRSLNSKEYHGIIVEAFSESWQMMFCDDDDTAEFANDPRAGLATVIIHKRSLNND